MALTYLADKIAGNRDKAAAIQAGFDAQVKTIRADVSLTDVGRRQRIAAAFQTARTQLANLKADEDKQIQTKHGELQRSLFGITANDPQSLIAYRDAQDRADALDDPRVARTVMDRALMTDDKTLAAAVLSRSLSSGWSDVIDAYRLKHPDQADRLSDLGEIEDTLGSAGASIYGAMAYSLPTPNELNGVWDHQLADLAAGIA